MSAPAPFGTWIAEAREATAAGYTVQRCAHCGGWVWWPPEHELTAETRATGRVFCSTRKCERREGEMRRAPAQEGATP